MGNDRRKEIMEEIEECGKLAQGSDEYIKYLEGGKISKPEAIKAMCYQCQHYYADGKEDCQNILCPLYPFMPYGNSDQAKKRQVSEKEKVRLKKNFSWKIGDK